MADELTKAIIVMACINMMLFLGQIATLDLNPESPSFYNCEGNFLGLAEANGCTTGTYVLNANSTGTLPSGDSSVSPTTGNVFTDAFTSAKTWIVRDSGLGYFIAVLMAPYSFLNALGLPATFVFAVGSMWYLICIFLFVAWLLGR